LLNTIRLAVTIPQPCCKQAATKAGQIAGLSFMQRPQMSHRNVRPAVLLAAAAVAASAAPSAMTAETAPADELSEVVVYGIVYRNRTTDTAPVLSYDLEYFQRFEPATVGDMLKRVTSAVFVSDVLEYDGVQLRGLDPGYTQVLINGKKVPGAGDDRSFWVDRIPADMIERVEILRSNSANRSGDALAGSLNIVLRDAYAFEGNYLRAGAIRYDDSTVQPTAGAVFSGEALGGRLLAGLNVQDRYNPKIKRSDRFSDPLSRDFDSAEDQTDTRDGQDYSGNFSYVAEVGDTARLSLDGFWVKTDRELTEISTEYNAPLFADADEYALVPGLGTVDQQNWGLGAEYRFELAGGTTEIDLDHARFEDDSAESEEEIAFENGVWDSHEGESEQIDATDAETSLKIAHRRSMGFAQMEVGVDYRSKQRDSTIGTFEFEAQDEGDPVVYQPDNVVTSRIEEDRIDPYLMFSGHTGPFSWEAGLRHESTDSSIAYRPEPTATRLRASQDYSELLPSLHLKWDVGADSRINLSLARSMRRPNFNLMLPALLDGEYGDNDFIGNPQLHPEVANGIDLGFERRLGRRGVVGINVFYRDVADLIELVNTGEASEDALDSYEEDIEEYMDANGVSEAEARAAVPFDPDSFVFSASNVGDGKVWGVELDLSTPLTAFGLPDTGVFLNYSWLDSEVSDFLGERRFNNQARSVYNIGFIQSLPAWAASFGASYRKQGRAFSRVLAEEVRTTYDADLEIFIEKTFGRNLSLRLSGTNLLDAKKREYFHKFDNGADQLDRDYDEYEEESEFAGPRYQLVVRWAF
jgi:outer membrane receptor protein involved in Fe transport